MEHMPNPSARRFPPTLRRDLKKEEITLGGTTVILLCWLSCLLPSPALAQSPPGVGDLVITEIMYNPTAVPDVFGEWFEIHNVSGEAVELAGLTVEDYGTDSFTISGPPSIPLADGAFFVLGRNGDGGMNGGVVVDHAYGDVFMLGNSGDEIVIKSGTMVIDLVAYDAGPSFPDVDDVSLNLHLGAYSAAENDLGDNWCRTPYGTEYLLSGGDYASPGALGASCDDQVFVWNVTPYQGVTTGGETVSIAGDNFTGTTDVSFGGVSCPAFSVVDDGEISCETPAHAAGIVDIVVTRADGYGILPGNFLYVVPSSVPDGQPLRCVLHPCVPNPFNPLTTIDYELSAPARVSLRVFDLSGRAVRTLLDAEPVAAGRRQCVWRGRDEAGREVAAGTYFYRLEAGGFNSTRRMTLIR